LQPTAHHRCFDGIPRHVSRLRQRNQGTVRRDTRSGRQSTLPVERRSRSWRAVLPWVRGRHVWLGFRFQHVPDRVCDHPGRIRRKAGIARCVGRLRVVHTDGSSNQGTHKGPDGLAVCVANCGTDNRRMPCYHVLEGLPKRVWLGSRKSRLPRRLHHICHRKCRFDRGVPRGVQCLHDCTINTADGSSDWVDALPQYRREQPIGSSPAACLSPKRSQCLPDVLDGPALRRRKLCEFRDTC